MQEQLSKPDTIDKKIDESQIKLRGLEQQTHAEELSKKLKEYDHAFFDQVNVYQDLDQTFKISSKEAIKHFGKGKKDIELYLRTIVATGKAWLEVKKRPSENSKDASKKPSADEVSAMAEVIDAQAKDLQQSLKEYRENMVAIGKMEEIKIVADDNFGRILETEKVFEIASADPDTLLKACNIAFNGQNGDTGYVGLKNMLQAHTELPEAYRAEIGNWLEKRLPAVAEKKSRAIQMKLIHDSYADAVALGFKNGKWELSFTEKGQSLDPSEKQKILTKMAAISLKIEENLEVATAPEFMQKFWIGKALFESGDLINAQKLLLVFSKTDSVKMDMDQRFTFKKADYLARTSEMLKAIDDQFSKHREFYEAQNLLQTGDVAGAKKLLKKYNYIGPATSVEEESYRQSAKALLQKIALAQLQSVEEKFNAIKPLSSPQLAEHKYGSGPGSRKEYADMLQRIRAGITTGKYVDFVEAYKAEFSKLTFPGDRYFNCLEDILEEEKGKSGLLALARKYRELGRRDLAEDYFRRYFGEKLNATAKKSDQIPALGAFEKQMRVSYKFIAREGNEWEKSKHQLEEQYDKKAASNPDWTTQNPLDQYLKKARAANAKQLIDGAYQDLVIREQNHQFIAQPANFGGPEEKAAWGEYMNMKGYHGEEKWWSPAALSDEMAEELTKNLVIDIAITAASAGLGGIAAGVVKEAITAARFGKLAVAMGGHNALAEVAGFATESAVFFLGDKTLRNVIHKEEFKLSMQDFLVSTLHLGGFQALGKTTHALGLGNASKALRKTTALSSQLAFQGAASGGELSLKDLAFIVGLEIVHGRGKGEKKTAGEKAVEEARTKEAAAARKEMKANYDAKIKPSDRTISEASKAKEAHIEAELNTYTVQLAVAQKALEAAKKSGADAAVLIQLGLALSQAELRVEAFKHSLHEAQREFYTSAAAEISEDVLRKLEGDKRKIKTYDGDDIKYFKGILEAKLANLRAELNKLMPGERDGIRGKLLMQDIKAMEDKLFLSKAQKAYLDIQMGEVTPESEAVGADTFRSLLGVSYAQAIELADIRTQSRYKVYKQKFESGEYAQEQHNINQQLQIISKKKDAFIKAGGKSEDFMKTEDGKKAHELDAQLIAFEGKKVFIEFCENPGNFDKYPGMGIQAIAVVFGKAGHGFQMLDALSLARRKAVGEGQMAPETARKLMDVTSTVGESKVTRVTDKASEYDKAMKDDVSLKNQVADIRKEVRQADAANMKDVISKAKNPADRLILEKAWEDLIAIVSKEGKGTLSVEERQVIFEYSIGYLADFKTYTAKMGKSFNINEVFELVRDNQRKLAHQAIFDKLKLTGSDHGVTHLLEGNMKLAEKAMKDMNMSPEDRILVRQALIDHDMGYTMEGIRTKAVDTRLFMFTKDHPIYSTLYVEGNRAMYEKFFGGDGYNIIHDAVLDHSVVMTKRRNKLDAIKYEPGKEFNGNAVRAVVAMVDCLGTTADVKISTIYTHPEIIGNMQKLRLILDHNTTVGSNGKPIVNLAKVKQEGQKVMDGMKRMLHDMPGIDQATKDIFIASIESSLSAGNFTFPVDSNLGMYGAGIKEISIEKGTGKLTVDFVVDPNMQKAIVNSFANVETGQKVSMQAIMKAMKDFGFDPEKDSSPQLEALKKGQIPQKGVVKILTSGGVEFRISVSEIKEYAHAKEVLDRNNALQDLRTRAIADLATLTEGYVLRKDKIIEIPASAKAVLVYDRIISIADKYKTHDVKLPDGRMASLVLSQLAFEAKVFQMGKGADPSAKIQTTLDQIFYAEGQLSASDAKLRITKQAANF